jgi:biopolymer transport protein ExbD
MMSFGGFQDRGEPQPMAEINTTPLVDVMLVLLIIFIITAPLLTHAIRIDVPQARSESSPEKPQTITVAIDGAGRVFWNGEEIGRDALGKRFSDAASKSPQPELHLRADRDTRYQVLAEVMSLARGAGVARIGFVTDPNAPSGAVAAPAGGGAKRN